MELGLLTYSLNIHGIGIQNDLSEAVDGARQLDADIVKVGLDMRRPRPVAASRFHPKVIDQLTSVANQLKTVAPRAADHGIRLAVDILDQFPGHALHRLRIADFLRRRGRIHDGRLNRDRSYRCLWQ
jgi:sugar phosphate isomerase/epimerase